MTFLRDPREYMHYWSGRHGRAARVLARECRVSLLEVTARLSSEFDPKLTDRQNMELLFPTKLRNRSHYTRRDERSTL